MKDANEVIASTNIPLLKRQTRIVGYVVDNTPITTAHREELSGLWEFLHCLLDIYDNKTLGGKQQ
jgi:hypothetical protein